MTRPTFTPYRLEVPQRDLDDLHDRTRWPDELAGVGWDLGVPLDYLKELAGYRRHDYDWPAAQARINAWPQLTTEVDGAHLHLAHVRSPEPNATPLLLSHGWPGSIVEFTDPSAIRGPTGATQPTRSTWSCRASPVTGSPAPRRRPGGTTAGSRRPSGR